MPRTDKYLQYSSIIWLVWPNSLVFAYKLSVCWLESRCSHLNFRYCTCLEHRVPWHSGKYRLWTLSEMCTWIDSNIRSKSPYRNVLTTELNHLASLTKYIGVRLETKCMLIWVPWQSFKLQIWRLFWTRSFVIFRKL